ncbi:MAG: hypothetical protein DDT20_01640 [Firmicutes bacterium]|nr:hypothetical protein [Bacillota bacterium]
MTKALNFSARPVTAFVVLVLFLAVYLPMGILQYARAYVAFANHRHSRIPFEIMTSFGDRPSVTTRMRLGWYWPPWRLHSGHLWANTSELVAVSEHRATSVRWSAIWGATAEAKLVDPNFTFIADIMNWQTGQPVSGLTELTLIGTAASESVHSLEERWDPLQQRMVDAYVLLGSTYWQVYNQGPIWYVFSAHTSLQADLRFDDELAELLTPERRGNRGHGSVPRGTFPSLSPPESEPAVVTALDGLAERARQIVPGNQPREVLLAWVQAIDYRDAGIFRLSDSAFLPFIIWSTVLYYPSLPIRYLLFAPLVVAPHWLVIPLVLVYPVLLLVLVGWLTLRQFTPRLWLWWKWLFWSNFLVWFMCS